MNWFPSVRKGTPIPSSLGTLFSKRVHISTAITKTHDITPNPSGNVQNEKLTTKNYDFLKTKRSVNKKNLLSKESSLFFSLNRIETLIDRKNFNFDHLHY